MTGKMRLSILMPVYNEKKTLLSILKKVESVDLKNIEKEIIIVDDCSTDGTREVLRGLKYKIFYHDINKGKGAAIKTAMQHATGDILVIQDADLEYDPQDLKKLITPILDGTSKVVYGSRFLGSKYKIFGKERTILPLHYIGNKVLNIATSILYQTKITDMETCYKIFTRDVIRNMKLRAQRFDFEPEITAKILRQGYKIVEIPISYNGRGFEEGKNITWRDGFAAAYSLLRYRFFD